MAIPEHLSKFLKARPSLKVIHRSDPDFESTKEIYIDTPDVPLLIVRPQNEADVAALVGHLSSSETRLVVRAGGHDLSARSVAQDAVQIDLRDIASVKVAEDKSTAKIGGGILTQDLLDGLAAEGLMTAIGNAGSVGWTSWAMNGGYGIMAGKLGLGCDQIIGARVVLADGTVVQADEQLLKALRGCGPAFGVVVELQIKVYPLTEITAGVIACDSSDLQSSVTTYFDNCRSFMRSTKLPKELYFQPMLMTPPGAPAAGFVVQFVWAGPPSDEQTKWLENVTKLAPGGAPAVVPVIPGDYTRQLSKMIDSHIRGGETRTVSMRSLVPSPGAAAVLAKNAQLITPEWGAVFIHMIHGESVRSDKEHPGSVFASREEHLMVEMLGFAYRDDASKEPASAWCKDMFGQMKAADGVMDKAYFPLMKESALELEDTYKTEELAFLRGLKKKLDPRNVFSNAMPLAA